VDGDSCDSIVASAGISNSQFSKWNPYIDDSMNLLSPQSRSWRNNNNIFGSHAHWRRQASHPI